MILGNPNVRLVARGNRVKRPSPERADATPPPAAKRIATQYGKEEFKVTPAVKPEQPVFKDAVLNGRHALLQTPMGQFLGLLAYQIGKRPEELMVRPPGNALTPDVAKDVRNLVLKISQLAREQRERYATSPAGQGLGEQLSYIEEYLRNINRELRQEEEEEGGRGAGNINDPRAQKEAAARGRSIYQLVDKARDLLDRVMGEATRSAVESAAEDSAALTEITEETNALLRKIAESADLEGTPEIAMRFAVVPEVWGAMETVWQRVRPALRKNMTKPEMQEILESDTEVRTRFAEDVAHEWRRAGGGWAQPRAVDMASGALSLWPSASRWKTERDALQQGVYRLMWWERVFRVPKEMGVSTQLERVPLPTRSAQVEWWRDQGALLL